MTDVLSAPDVADPVRIASYVMGGIGFLGAGGIWKARGEVTGAGSAWGRKRFRGCFSR